MRQLTIRKAITNRESASIDKYLNEISRENLISAEEEVELAQRIKRGDQKALEKLTKANLRFVVSVAKQYQNQGLSLPDLINEGNLGLIKAASKFDETRGFKFISYAVWWIRQSIIQALAQQSRVVRLPLNQIGLLNKVKQNFAKLEQEYGRPPTAQELSNLMDIPKEKITNIIKLQGKHLSIDAPFSEDEDNSLLNTLENNNTPKTDQSLIKESLGKEIERLLTTLSSREEGIIKFSFGINSPELTLEEISKKFSLTKERVRQIREKALARLRNSSKSYLLKNYLG